MKCLLGTWKGDELPVGREIEEGTGSTGGDDLDGFGDGLYGSANLVGPDLGCVDTDRHIAHASTCSISIK